MTPSPHAETSLSETPQVVVACAWYNRPDYIRDTVDSLLAQDFDSFEVVIVNDGSTDPRVREILDSYDDPRLRVIHQENTGFIGAISNAIAASNAPFIAIQGSADISYPDRLRKQADVLISRPDVAVVGSRVDNILDMATGRTRVYGTPIDGDVSEEALRRVIMMHGEAMYRRDLYEKVGGYRPFFRFSQDRDLWCRLSREGKFVILDDVLCNRYANMGGVSGDAQKQIVQRFLSHFAVYCHQKVLEGKRDPIDQYGAQAGLMFQGDRALQRGLIKLAFRYFLMSRPSEAQQILTAASEVHGGRLANLVAWSLQKFPKQMKPLLIKLRGDARAE